MAENSGENAGQLTPEQQFEVPKEPQETQEAQEALAERAIENRQVSEGSPTRKAPKFPAQPTAVAPPAQQDQQSPQGPSDATLPTAKLTAQDVDLIEKEWVERAKNIVAKTQDDPYKQKDEMSKIKVDYIKKRFDKTIPLDDAAKT